MPHRWAARNNGLLPAKIVHAGSLGSPTASDGITQHHNDSPVGDGREAVAATAAFHRPPARALQSIVDDAIGGRQVGGLEYGRRSR